MVYSSPNTCQIYNISFQVSFKIAWVYLGLEFALTKFENVRMHTTFLLQQELTNKNNGVIYPEFVTERRGLGVDSWSYASPAWQTGASVRGAVRVVGWHGRLKVEGGG